MKKTFYTADEKSCEYEKYFVKKSKNRDKLIQSETPEQHIKNQDCPGKTGTVECFPAIRMISLNNANSQIPLWKWLSSPCFV